MTMKLNTFNCLELTFSFRTVDNFFEEENQETPQLTLKIVDAEYNDSASRPMSTLTLCADCLFCNSSCITVESEDIVLSPVPVKNDLVAINCSTENVLASPKSINASHDIRPTPGKRAKKRTRDGSEDFLEVWQYSNQPCSVSIISSYAF